MKKYLHIINTISALLSSSLVVLIDKWLSEYVANPIFSLSLAIILSATAGLMVEAVLNYFPKFYRPLRLLISPMSNFEGLWIQYHETTQEYAICKVEYIGGHEEYRFSGEHFKSNGKTALFTSSSIHFDETSVGFDYLVEGQHDNGAFVKCWGYVNFNYFPGISKSATDGRGSFVEISDTITRTFFHMFRPSKRIISQLKTSSKAKYRELLAKAIDDFHNQLGD